MSAVDDNNIDDVSRRDWIKTAVFGTATAATTTTASLFLFTTNAAHATVDVDPDRYGDKELKIATVNKIRQNVRNAIVATPSLAPLLVKLAIQDALKYNAATGEGGPDGSIVRVVLESSGDPSLTSLRPAADKLSEIAKNIKRTTEITMADVVTFAGAEAIESTGGPRVVVQLGKTDPRGKNNNNGSKGAVVPDLFGNSGSKNGKQVVAAFKNAGLTEREAALLYGAIGSMEKVASQAKQGVGLNAGDVVVGDDDEPNEMGDVEVFIPSSFGAPKEIYGKTIGVMDNSYYVSTVGDVKKGRKPGADVFTDDKVLEWATKYAGNKGGFLKDLPEAYTKTMSLGTKYTGGKVGSLLGQEDNI